MWLSPVLYNFRERIIVLHVSCVDGIKAYPMDTCKICIGVETHTHTKELLSRQVEMCILQNIRVIGEQKKRPHRNGLQSDIAKMLFILSFYELLAVLFCSFKLS